MRAPNSLAQRPIYEFGEFRLDSAERVLLKDGRPLSIFPKSLDVLIVFLENRGHIVEKEELIRPVWPGLFVEDNNLVFNISVLRKALGESSASPQYIETVSKRGYRFIAEVHEIYEGLPAAGPARPQSPPDPPPMLVTRRFAWPYTIAAIAVMMATAGILAYFLNRRPKIEDQNTIILPDFTNKAGDSVFDGTLHQGLVVELEQSPFLSLVSEGRIRQTLALMGQPANAALTPEIARAICVRTRSAAVLEGSIASLASQFLVGLLARNCTMGDVLYTAQLQAPRKEDVLNTLSRLARIFRSHMGESLTKLPWPKRLPLEPMHGFGITRRIEQISSGVFKVNPGSLLTALQRLERAGWLDAEWRQTENSRRAKIYTLTRAGKKQLEAETSDWERRTLAIARLLKAEV